MLDKQKIQLANQVLSELEKKDWSRIDGYIEMYSNGKEHGYALFIKTTPNDKSTICFSQQRDSKDVVVYVGTSYDFDVFSGNIPKNNTYKNRNTFASAIDAAEYIFKYICEITY